MWMLLRAACFLVLFSVARREAITKRFAAAAVENPTLEADVKHLVPLERRFDLSAFCLLCVAAPSQACA